MDLIEEIEVRCPYCGGPFMVEVDTTEPDTVLIEDCSVCCQPVAVRLHCKPGKPEILSVERP